MYIPAEKMKNKKSHTVGTVPRSTRNIVEKGILMLLTHKYMTFIFLTWYRHYNKKWWG